MTRTIRRIGAAVLALGILLSLGLAASAASVPEATIDTGRTGSIDIYKYDLTRANADESVRTVLDSYVSTGIRDESLEAALDDGTVSDLGNGRTSSGYAVRGVEFSLLKVADITAYEETETDGTHRNMILYGMPDAESASFLSALGLSAADAYGVTEDFAQSGILFFRSETLTEALRTALENDPTAVKNALETIVASRGAETFDETDEHGHTAKTDLPLGLYLIVETKVPETVTFTTDPFLVSVPMTSVNGTNAENGGGEWIYDITLYPKNETGIPTLEKTVREALEDTGKNDGTEAVDDGYAHSATASCGDRVEYQIVSRLPAVTSAATALTDYTFVDNLSAGLTYDGNPAAADALLGNYDAGDVRIGWFRDAACTDGIAAWSLTDAVPKFAVSYETGTDGEKSMTVSMTEAGLDEINRGEAAREGTSGAEQGYSSCWIRISYSATVNRDDSVVIGDEGNPNTVVLTWKRSNMDYWDTLADDCHVHTYALDLTKEFSDDKGDFGKVTFKVFNATDGYWVTAKRTGDGTYVVGGEDEPAGHAAGTADEDGSKGTAFVPNSTTGVLTVRGLEDDEYIVTETKTDSGYTLLKEDIRIVIEAEEDPDRPCGIYGTDVLGLVQNDARYETFEGYRELAHDRLTASATVDGDEVAMEPENGSAHAQVPLTVVNTPGFNLPRTGDSGVWQYSLFGLVLMAAAAAVIAVAVRTGRKDRKTK